MTFQEIFFTLLVIWIVFRIFRSTSNRKQSVFNFTTHHHHTEKPKEGENKVKTEGVPKRKDIKEGEYVDFEEIKE